MVIRESSILAHWQLFSNQLGQSSSPCSWTLFVFYNLVGTKIMMFIMMLMMMMMLMMLMMIISSSSNSIIIIIIRSIIIMMFTIGGAGKNKGTGSSLPPTEGLRFGEKMPGRILFFSDCKLLKLIWTWIYLDLNLFELQDIYHHLAVKSLYFNRCYCSLSFWYCVNKMRLSLICVVL